jgi:hypothetical protein
MYVTSEMTDRWKEIYWLQIDKRCWKATCYGPDSREFAHLHEARGTDGKPWPEWLGEEPADHSDNEAREAAREELNQDIAMPCYTGIVEEATVTQRMSIATEAIMSHLSNSIPMNHAKPKAEGGAALGGEILTARNARACRQPDPGTRRSDRGGAVHPRPHWDGPERGP